MPDVRTLMSFFLVLLMCVGCDEEEQKMREWSRENSAAAQTLVEADAESRKQFTALQQSLQTERQTLADGHTALEADRKAVVAARERVPLLATALQGLAALALGSAALWVCGRLLSQMPDDAGAAELEETLILSLTGESDLLAERPVLLKPPEGMAALTAAEPVTDTAPALTDK